MRTLNLGILAHVDAGKTSLTERLLHAAGVIDEVGRVDDGSTQTDFLALERQRGITIKSAVVSFVLNGVTVNLIDTPGHPDFIAEVERVLNVLDGAVLVVSAVEGVQPQTRVLMRALQRLGIPTVLFVNKIDRAGAQHDRVLREIAERLTPATVSMGSTSGLGTRGAAFTPYGTADSVLLSLIDVLAGHDDALLAAYVDGRTLPYRRLRRALAAQTKRALVHPVFFGSAITGAGVDSLTAGITELLPAAVGMADGPVSGRVFKVERGPAGDKIAYVRLFSGTVRIRDRVELHPGNDQRRHIDDRSRDSGGCGGDARDGEPGDAPARAKVTSIGVFEQGAAVPSGSVAAGQIAKLGGLGGVKIGDTIGRPRRAPGHHHFAPPTLETVVVPAQAAHRGALHLALAQLAEQDPLINLRHDEIRGETYLSLYGEVQKEVIQATLADDFGIEVTFRETTTIYIERPVGTGAAVEMIKKDGNPFLATVGLRIEPAPVGTGVQFRIAVELGSMPFSFFKAVEETVCAVLHEGLHGWRVTDCLVTMTHSGYWPRQSHAHQGFSKSMSSTAGDFRNLTPLVLMSALAQAGTAVHEPMHRFRLDVPADTIGLLLPALARLRAVPQSQSVGGSSGTLEGEIPAANVHELRRQLPALTQGEGVLESAFDHYQPVRGPAPSRPRTDHNPLDRKEYLLHVLRRV